MVRFFTRRRFLRPTRSRPASAIRRMRPARTSAGAIVAGVKIAADERAPVRVGEAEAGVRILLGASVLARIGGAFQIGPAVQVRRGAVGRHCVEQAVLVAEAPVDDQDLETGRGAYCPGRRGPSAALGEQLGCGGNGFPDVGGDGATGVQAADNTLARACGIHVIVGTFPLETADPRHSTSPGVPRDPSGSRVYSPPSTSNYHSEEHHDQRPGAFYRRKRVVRAAARRDARTRVALAPASRRFSRPTARHC